MGKTKSYTSSAGASAKSTVTFIDTSGEVKDAMAKLSKSALRASGRVVGKKLKERIASTGLVHSNRFSNHVGMWAYIDKKTGQPQLQVGFYSHARVMKKGKAASHASPHWIEFGTKPHEIKAGVIVSKGKTIRHTKTKLLGYGGIFGSKVEHPGQRATHLLRDTIQSNISEIQAAQEKYLAELNKDIEEATKKIDEGEEDEIV